MRYKAEINPIKILGDDIDKLDYCNNDPNKYMNYIKKVYGKEISDCVYIILVELLENALLHNEYEDSFIQYEVEINDGMVYVRVINKATCKQIKMFKDKIKEYKNAEKQDEVYRLTMSDDNEGGLGLLRILYYQKSTIEIHEKENNYIEFVVRVKI
jgi:hypothetical protein